jgi:hypothetical protein
MAENERRASDQPVAIGSDRGHRGRIDHTTDNAAWVPVGSRTDRQANQHGWLTNLQFRSALSFR